MRFPWESHAVTIGGSARHIQSSQISSATMHASDFQGKAMSGDRADIVLTGVIVHTVDASNRIAEAIAVSDGRSLAVGSNAEVNTTAGPDTRHIELNGRSLTPGFIDSHQHFTGVGGAEYAIDCKAPGMDSIAAIVEQVRQRTGFQPVGS
jgi:predicted amidohydrolase YtcJ